METKFVLSVKLMWDGLQITPRTSSNSSGSQFSIKWVTKALAALRLSSSSCATPCSNGRNRLHASRCLIASAPNTTSLPKKLRATGSFGRPTTVSIVVCTPSEDITVDWYVPRSIPMYSLSLIWIISGLTFETHSVNGYECSTPLILQK